MEIIPYSTGVKLQSLSAGFWDVLSTRGSLKTLIARIHVPSSQGLIERKPQKPADTVAPWEFSLTPLPYSFTPDQPWWKQASLTLAQKHWKEIKPFHYKVL